MTFEDMMPKAELIAALHPEITAIRRDLHRHPELMYDVHRTAGIVAQKLTGSPSAGFLIFAGLALVALAGLTAVKGRWRSTWGAGLETARV